MLDPPSRRREGEAPHRSSDQTSRMGFTKQRRWAAGPRTWRRRRRAGGGGTAQRAGGGGSAAPPLAPPARPLLCIVAYSRWDRSGESAGGGRQEPAPPNKRRQLATGRRRAAGGPTQLPSRHTVWSRRGKAQVSRWRWRRGTGADRRRSRKPPPRPPPASRCIESRVPAPSLSGGASKRRKLRWYRAQGAVWLLVAVLVWAACGWLIGWNAALLHARLRQHCSPLSAVPTPCQRWAAGARRAGP